MSDPNFIDDFAAPLDMSPGDRFVVQPVGPRTNDYVAPTAAQHWIAGMAGTFDGINRNTTGSYLPLAGGTLVGPLTLAADPVAALQPVTLQYFNTHTGGGGGPFLPLATGGTVTAPTTIGNLVNTSNALKVTPLGATTPFVADTAQVYSYYQTAASGGSGVVSNGRFETSITGAPTAFLWSVLGITDFNGTGGNGQHVPIYGQGIRRTHIAGGTGNNPQIWGATFQTVDFTNTDSALTNALTSVEIDMNVGNTDSAQNRSLVTLALNKANGGDVNPTAHTGIGMYTDTGSTSFDSALRIWVPYNNAALDFRSANENAGATIWFGNNASSIAWRGDGAPRTYWDAAAFSSVGGVHFNTNLQVDGTLFAPNQLVVGGLASFSGGVTLNAGKLSLNTGVSAGMDFTGGGHIAYWDAAAFSSSGGVHFVDNVQVDGTLFAPNQLVVGGGGAFSGTFSGAHTYSSRLTMTGGVSLTNTASAPTILVSGNATTLSNANPIGWLKMSGFIGGTVTSDTQPPGAISITVDDKYAAVVGPASPTTFNIQHFIAPSGNTASGNRCGLNVAVVAVGARQGGSYTYPGINQAAQFTYISQGNVGGTALSPKGAQTAIAITSTLSYDSGTSTGATYFFGNAAVEFDTATQAGASTVDENTILIVHTNDHAVQATREDNAIVISDQNGTSAQRKVLMALGSASSQWPLDATQGAVIQARISEQYLTIPPGAKWGVDLQQCGFPAFSTTARAGFLTSNGFAVDGLGAVQIGTAYATPSSTGLAVDCKGLVGTGTPTVNSGGTGYVVGDIIYDAWGGIYVVHAVSGGVVTSVTLYTDGNGNTRQPLYPSSSAPSNPVATTTWNNTVGSGLTLTLSWNTTATTLSLQPSGGPIIVGGSGGHLGFNSATPIAKPAVTGAKLPSDVVLASLLTALSNYGLITDSST